MFTQKHANKIISLVLTTIALIFIFSSSVYIFIYNTEINHNQFSNQAQSFLNGKTDIPKDLDTVDIGDKHYWHQPPLPSLLLLPFQLILGPSFGEEEGMLVLIPLLTLFLYKIIRLSKFNLTSAFFLILAFIFGSVVGNLVLTPVSWFFSQMIATTILTALIFELETKRRYFLLGILIACLIGTRVTSATIALYICFLLVKDYSRNKQTLHFLKQVLVFTFPIIISVSLLLWFNYIRFGNPLFYTYHASTTNPLLDSSKAIGIFSIEHIPSNIYYGFLTSIIPVMAQDGPNLVFPYITYSKMGISFFIICPFFLYAFYTFKTNKPNIRGYWLIIIITLVPLITYYGFLGFMSFGPRYFTDFLPLLFFLAIKGLATTSLTTYQKNLILLSASFNTYLLLSRIIAFKY